VEAQMDDESKTPMLLRLMFGEAAGTARSGASPRLLRWGEAFDGWLAERGSNGRESTGKQARLAWRRLLNRCGKMPWELRQADIEAHVAWMEAEGYSAATIANGVGILANFFRWCDEHQTDPECGAGFNPVAMVRRPKVGRYRGAKVLSREEVERLLRTMRADPSELGKRDHAFTLARLRLGAPLRAIQHLKWGQIEEDDEGAWVRFAAGRQRLATDVLEAIRAALEAGGRLAGMQAKDYIFAPLKEPLKVEAHDRAEVWLAVKPLTSSQLLANLKLYGRLAGIDEEKLTLMALRRTATRLRLDEGASTAEMQEFLGSREEGKFAKYRLARLPQPTTIEDARLRGSEGAKVRTPMRTGKPFKPGEGVKHGMYTRSLPAQAVAAVAGERIQGIDEELVGMRILGRDLLEREKRARNKQEATQLWEAYTLAAYRLGGIMRGEKEQSEHGKAGREWAERFLAMMDRVEIEKGNQPISEKVRREARGFKDELAVEAHSTAEEIASLRYVLRNVFRLATEAEETGEYIRLVEIYSSGCVRLMKLLRMEQPEGDQLAKFLQDTIQQAIKAIAEEWGLHDR
jgi:site-specific recombinase XerD